MRRHTLFPALLIAGFVAGATLLSAPAYAQHHGGGHGHGVVVVGGGYYYDPFWGPYPYWGYPYPYYHPYYVEADRSGDVRLQVTPKEAQVYVDGYYAGVVDDFDGMFQRLSLPEGEHEIVVRMDGYRTVHQKIAIAPHKTYKLKYAMEKLAPGEQMEPVPQPTAPPPTAEGQQPPRRPMPGPYPPRPPRQGQAPPPPQGQYDPRAERGQSGDYGTLAVRVQPAGAEIMIDGQPWQSSDPDATLLVQLAPGMHRIEIRKEGFRPYSQDVDVRGGGTTPVNVSLSPVRN